MDSKEFITYVRDQRRIGLDDTQIARKLGMDIGIFKDAVDFAFNDIKKEESVVEKILPAAVAFEGVEEKPKAPRKPRKKVDVEEVPQGE